HRTPGGSDPDQTPTGCDAGRSAQVMLSILVPGYHERGSGGGAMTVTEIRIAGRYRLVRSLGQGGMGRVWLARDEVLHRDVAIKEVIPPEGLTQAEREEMRQRTLREARAAARLNHPSVVRVYDVVRTDVHPWIVMEYVPSRSLHEVIADDGILPPARAAGIGLQVLGA